MLRPLLNSFYEKLLSRLGMVLLALALVINLGALLAVDQGIAALAGAREHAEHSRDVMTRLLGLQSMLYENESAQRGFLLTGSESYLETLKENKGKVAAGFATLLNEVADNPPQRSRIERIGKIAAERMALLNNSITVYEAGQKEAARLIVESGRGRKLMEVIDADVSIFLVEEERLRQDRTRRGADIQLATRWGFAAILFINALMILAGAVTIMRGMAREAARNEADLVQHDERSAAEVVRNNERMAVSAAAAEERAMELRALSVHLLSVQEDERRTIAREMHDELGGTLSAIKMDILMARDAAAKRSDEKSVARLQRALAATDSSVQFIRRLIEDLRPTLLDNLGFEAALRSMTEQFSERAGCQCAISLPDDELNKLTAAQSTALYRICQEALTNVSKYAKAKHVGIFLTCDGSKWRLQIADDGVGLDATNQHRAISHGLLGMRERVFALGGIFDIRGKADLGTKLTAEFPVASEPPAV